MEFDFESAFNVEQFSDVLLLLQEEGPPATGARSGKRKYPDAYDDKSVHCTTLHCHGIVLLCCSEYFKAKLEGWSDARTAGDAAHQIHLDVPAGQLQLAERLIKCIYQKKPAVADLSQAQLLQLLLLADNFQVPKVQAAALAVLQAVPATGWEWQTVLDVLGLPTCIAQQEACKAVVDAAAVRLQQQLGDLDMVWADEQLQQLLLSLPYERLLQLLQDNRTKVASEHTVVFTILRWYQQPSTDRSVAQLRQLSQEVRLQYCSPHYITTFMRQSSLVLECFKPSELAVASLLSSAPAAALRSHSLSKRYPALTAPKRPASRQPQVIEWHLPLPEIKQLVEKHLIDHSVVSQKSSMHVRQGQLLCTRVQIVKGDGASSSIAIGVFLRLEDCSEEQEKEHHATVADCCKVNYTISASLAGVNGEQHLTSGLITAVFCRGYNSGWGQRDFIKIEGVSTWGDVVTALKTKHLVQHDNNLHVQVKLHSVG